MGSPKKDNKGNRATTTVTCPACRAKNRIPDASRGRPRCGTCHVDLPWLSNVSGRDFDTVIARSSLPVLVDLWAPWCGPCRTIAPILERLAVERAGTLRVVKVNVDKAPEVSARLRVQGIPTMVLFDGGKEIARQVGAVPAARIGQWLDSELAPRTGRRST